MKIKLKLNILIIIFGSILILNTNCLNLRQFPKDAKGQATQDQEFRQANIPPIITVMMDVPAFGVKYSNNI